MEKIFGLSCGKINLTTGKTKHFNVFDNNTADDTLLLLKTVGKDVYTVISGSGSPERYSDYRDKGDMLMESRCRAIKAVIAIQAFHNTKACLAEIKEIVKKNKCSFWVFK